MCRWVWVALLVAVAVPSLPCVAAELTYRETVTTGQGDVPAFFPIGTVVSPDGRHVYVSGDDGEGLIARFERDRETGALTYLSRTQVGSGGLYVPWVAAAPDGRHLYAATSDGVAVFARNLGTGELADAGFVPFGSGALAGVSTGSCVVASDDGLHVYVTTTEPGALSVFARNATSGALTHVETEIDDAARHLDGLQRVVLGPDGEQVYALGSGDHVQLFARDTGTGALSLVGDTGTALDSPTDLEMTADGTGLYTASLGPTSSAIEFNRFPRDLASGMLGTPLTGLALGYAGDLAADPDGGHLYAAGNAQIAILSAQLAAELPFPANGAGGITGLGAITRIAMAPDGQHLYAISDSPQGAIGIFATPRFDFLEADFDGAASPGLDGATAVVVSPDGTSVYAAGAADDAIQQFARDPETGALSPIQVVRDGVGGVVALDGVRGIAVSPDGDHVYAASSVDDAVAAFTRDSFGFLAFLESETNGAGGASGLNGANAVVVAPDGRHVYVASNAGSSVAIFSRNGANGVLSPFGSVVDGAGGVDGIGFAQSIAISPGGEHVYVGGFGDDAIAIFSRDANDGALDFESFVTSADLDSVTGVAVSPDGAFVYATAYLGDALVRYTRHPVTGLLSSPVVTSHVTGVDDGLLRPLALSIAPDGAFLFVAAENGDVVAVHRRDAATGDVELIQAERDGSRVDDALGGVRALAVSPDGASLYAASDSADAVVTFAPEPGSLALGMASLVAVLACAGRRRAVRVLACCAGFVTLAAPAFAQFQSNFLTPSVQMGGVLGQTQVFAGSVEIDGTGPFDVALTAHVTVEAEPTSDAIYEIAICRDDLPGIQFIGRALWRLTDEDTSGVVEGDTITVTGFDANVTGPVTYSICARALTGAAPPVVTLSARGLDAVPMSPGSGSAGVTDSDLVADTTIVDDLEGVSVTSLDVSRDISYDVALAAHVVVTFTPNTAAVQRYSIGICRDSVSGPRVGNAFYRASRGSDPVTDTIAVTGFDPLRTGTTTYHLCARRIDADAPALTLELYGMHARTAPALGRLDGSETTNDLLATAIPSTASVWLAEVEADAAAPFDVVLTAHAYVEGAALSNDAYAIEICRDDENGGRVGLAQWRPLDSASPQGTIGDTVTLTGYDAGRTGPTTYVLCGRKAGSGVPTVTVSYRGIVAEALPVPEPGGAAAGLLASSVCVALRSRRHAPRR
jgi:6-phosphogluconolactonase (cycloisomerase 2 family)